METITSDRAKYIIAILSLTFICEIMFNINNRVIQMFGICILPMIFVYSALLFKNEKK